MTDGAVRCDQYRWLWGAWNIRDALLSAALRPAHGSKPPRFALLVSHNSSRSVPLPFPLKTLLRRLFPSFYRSYFRCSAASQPVVFTLVRLCSLRRIPANPRTIVAFLARRPPTEKYPTRTLRVSGGLRQGREDCVDERLSLQPGEQCHSLRKNLPPNPLPPGR